MCTDRRGRGLLAGLLLLLTLLTSASAAVAQSRPSLRIAAPAAGVVASGPTITARNLFGDARSRELLSAGFPARVTLEVDHWAPGRFGDERLGAVRSDHVVRWDAIAQRYRLGRVLGDRIETVGSYATLAELGAVLATPQALPALPPRAGRRGQYYSARLTVRALTSTDLGELERWLKGDLGGALQGERPAVSPLTRGLRTLLSRALGGQVTRIEARSAQFDR
jgi:hypothetical protein